MVWRLDKIKKILYKYIVNVEATWKQTGPGGGTLRLHHKHIEKPLAQVRYLVYDRKKKQILIITRNKRVAEHTKCLYDGAEIGSTDMKVEWSLPDDREIGQKN